MARVKVDGRSFGALIGLLALVGALIGVSSPVHAAPRQAALTPVASINPGGGRDPSVMAIDSEHARGYVVDRTNGMIEVYDVGETSMTLRTTFSTVSRPYSLVLDETRDLLFVNDAFGGRITSVDVNPSSVNYGQPLRQYGTPLTSYWFDVDRVTGTIYASSSDARKFTVIDQSGGSSVSVDAGGSPREVVVDSERHSAYAAIGGGILVEISADGILRQHVVGGQIGTIAFSGELLAAVVSRGSDPRVELFDTRNWQSIAQSAPIRSWEATLRADSSLHVLYVAYGNGERGIDILQLSTLASEAFVKSTNFLSEIAIDPSTHSVFVSDKYNIPAAVTMYRPLISPAASVTRIGGADRFAVASALAVKTFPKNIDTVYVATGLNFPDALAGAAAAGHSRSPVVLTERDKLPSATRQALSTLAPKRTVVVGGPASISQNVIDELREFGPVTRIGGNDRYDVSAALSKETFGSGARSVYVASGEVFADALSGSAAAGRESAPILLVRHDGVPNSVEAEIKRLNPDRVIVLGGRNTIGDDVIAQLGGSREVVRVDGVDRFAVSAAIAARSFSQSTYQVYVASGEVFPDALAGAAAAIADQSPVVLVQQQAIPYTVSGALAHLSPYQITIVGGPRTVDERLETELATYLPR